jgi:DNA-binding transcriptional LysR family regulator
MSIDLKQLKYFLAVAEEKSFSRAAERLHISQPPLSQQIMKLESELGVRLFARTTRSFELTVAGKALMAEASDLLARMRMTIDTIRQIDRGEVGPPARGHRRLGDVGADPEPAGALPDRIPARDLDPARVGPDVQFEALRSKQIDVGFWREPRLDEEELKATTCARNCASARTCAWPSTRTTRWRSARRSS